MGSLALVLTTCIAVIVFRATPITAQCCSPNGEFGCCGSGPCNFFCCNCDDGCNSGCSFNSKLLLDFTKSAASVVPSVLAFFGKDNDVRKRQVNPRFNVNNKLPVQSTSQYENTVNFFESVDQNRDRVIDFNEGLAYLHNVTRKRSVGKRSVKREDIDDFAKQFESIDNNRNGVIEPHEFDRTLA